MTKNTTSEKIKSWYMGKEVTVDFDNQQDSRLHIMPRTYTEYHWTATVARAVISWYLKNWAWFLSFVVAILAIIAAL